MTNHHPPLLVRYCHITSTKGYYILFYLFFLCVFSAAYDDPTSSNQGLMEKVRGKFLNHKLLCRYMIHELVLSLDFIIERFINGVLLIYVGSNRLGVGNQ